MRPLVALEGLSLIQGVSLPHTQCSQDKLQIHREQDEGKVVTKDEMKFKMVANTTFVIDPEPIIIIRTRMMALR